MLPSSDTHPTSPIPRQNPEDWSRMIVESAPNGIIVAEKSGHIVLTNEKAQTLFGYTGEEFAALKIEDLVPHRIRDIHAGSRGVYHETPEVRAMGIGRDLRAVRKDGSEFSVEIGLAPLMVPGRELVLSSIVDITRRKESEEKLHDYANELKFQAEILNNIHDAVFYLDGGGIIREWNQGGKRLFGHAASEIIGQHISLICTQDSRLLFEKIDATIRKSGISEEIIHCRDSSSSDVFVRATVTKMSRDGNSGYLVCASDITERKKLEAELLKVAEEQQRKIGQDIHDDLCSQLSGIGCLTKVLENRLAEDRKNEAEMMKGISEMVAAAGTTARQIAHGLVPSILENQGLADALTELVSVNRKTYGIDIRLIVQDKDRISEIENEISIQVYRIAQEAISNATRHSDAESILLTVGIEDHRLQVTIKDDGKGMSEDLVSLGLGLTTMRRRAKLLLADFDIHASPGGGTTIHCSIPIS